MCCAHLSLQAYMRWVEDHGEEPVLPSVNLTQYQAFFISYAQVRLAPLEKGDDRLVAETFK